MNKLENIVKKFARNTLLAGSLLFGGAFAQEAYSQNVVSGTVTSVPSNTPASDTRITFTNTSNGNKYSQRTTNGAFSINLPDGTYTKEIFAPGNYKLLENNVVITTSQTMNEKIIDDDPITSTVYGPSGQNKTLLELFKLLTNTDGLAGNTLLYRVTNQNPWRLYARNNNPSDPNSMPSVLRPFLEESIQHITTQIPEITFNEQFTEDLSNGITSVYVLQSEVPGGGYARTNADSDNAYIYFNKEDLPNSGNERKVYVREIFCRATLLYSLSTDTEFVTYYQGYGSGIIHNDEKNIARRMLNLDYLTDMTKHKNIILTSVPNTFFSTVSVNTPTYNTSNQLVVSHNRTNQRDPDGDIGNVEQVWNFYTMSNVLHHTVTVTNGDTVKVPENTFVENNQYKARVTVREKFNGSTINTITSSDLIFTARNKAPVVAANFTDGSTAAWDTNNQYKIIATVTDNDPTTTKIELYEGIVSPTTKIKEITGTQLTVNKNEVKGVEHVVKIYSNDGTTTTTILPHLYFPDNPTSLSLDAAENETFAWNANNQRIVNLTATDQDGPVSAKKVGVYETNNTLIKEINGEQLAVDKGPRGQKKIKAQGTQNGITTTLEILVNYPNNNPTGNADLVNESTLAWNASNKYRVNFTSSDYDSDAVSIASKAKNGASTLQQATGSFIDLDKANFQANTRYDLEVTFSDGYGGSYIHTIQFNTPNTPMNMSLDVATNETFVWDANNKRKIIMTATDADGPVSGKKVGVYNLANSVIQEIEGSELDVNKLPRGQYKAKGQGTQGPENKVVEVPFNAPNNNPTIADLVATYSGNTLNTSTTASDFDSDALSYKYTLTGNGANYTGTGSSWSLPLDQLQGGKEYDLTVEVSDQYNGKSTKTIKTTTPPITGVEDPKLIGDEVEISTFPNPVMDYINMKVKSSTPIKYHVEIYDNLGRLVDHDSQNHYGQEYEEKYDFSRFAPGQYFMKVTVEDSHGKSNTATRKLIKN